MIVFLFCFSSEGGMHGSFIQVKSRFCSPPPVDNVEMNIFENLFIKRSFIVVQLFYFPSPCVPMICSDKYL